MNKDSYYDNRFPSLQFFSEISYGQRSKTVYHGDVLFNKITAQTAVVYTIIHSKQTPVAGVVWFENDYRQTDVVFLDEYGELSVNNIWEKIDKFEVSEN